MIEIKPRHRELIGYVKEHRLRLFCAMVCMLLMAVTNSAVPFLLKNVVDDIFIDKKEAMLFLLPGIIVIIYSVYGLSMYGQEYLMNYVGQNVIRRLRNRLYDRIQDLPIAFFHREKTGVLMSRVTSDVNIVKDMVSSVVAGSLRDFFTILGMTFVIFYRDWKMAILAMVIMPVAYFPVVFLGRKVRKVTKNSQEAMADMSVTLHETFAGNKIIKAFGRENYEKMRFFEKTRRLFRIDMKTIHYKALSSPVMEFLGGIGASVVVLYGGSKVIAGTSTPGTFMSFMAAVFMLYGPVKKLSKLNNKVQQGLAGADRVFDIIETESDIREGPDPITIPRQPHRVAFQNVCFRYDQKDVLQNINLEAAAGEIIALVGMSGGGKTSLVNLIPRFYDVRKGGVSIDDIDIREASIASLRDQIAIVTQEPILFNDTVRNNIAYGCQQANDDQIVAAAKSAFAYDFITGFAKGFDTMIGELGSRLSGGEKQRICIARALIKDAPILILDEATSALDTQAETLVQKALKNLMQGRTTFVIAHRLSTVGYADRIVVLKQGKIVEEGCEDELLARKGEYFRLHRMQFKNGNG
jgi:subfamily B ATP-binding cassette protein MsbA